MTYCREWKQFAVSPRKVGEIMMIAIVYLFRFGGSLVGALCSIPLVCASNNGLVLIQVLRTYSVYIRRQNARGEEARGKSSKTSINDIGSFVLFLPWHLSPPRISRHQAP